MKILVTGGAGFIGSHLVAALVRKGHTVRVMDDFSLGHRENLAPVRKQIEIVKADCANPRAAEAAVRGMEVVYHEAAVPSVARSVADPLRSHRTNGTATLTMLVAARAAGVRRFIFAGSSSVYGDTKVLPKVETMTPKPRSPYALEKLTGELYVRIFAELFGMETLTLRYFNVFGPRQDPGSPYSGVISLFCTSLNEGKTPVLYGDGRQSRDFTYIDNVVSANLLALTAKGLHGQAVNVATATRVTLLDVLRILGRELGVRPKPVKQAPRAGDVRHSLADIRAARRLLGYRPHVDFDAGLRKTLEWYRAQSR
jgi:nucleoside-diphosphate-sugar epimerase